MEEVTFTVEWGHSKEKKQGDDSSICHTHTVYTVLYVCYLLSSYDRQAWRVV